MKKLIFVFVMLLPPLGMSAQEFLKIEKIEYDYVCSKTNWHLTPGWCRYDHRAIKEAYLSNGHHLYRTGHHLSEGFIWDSFGKHHNIKTNIMSLSTNFLKDRTFVYHDGELYWVETMEHKATYFIKKVSVREVKRETAASLNGDFGYAGFLALWKGTGGGIGAAKGKISGSMQGGTKTVVNIFFEGGGYASIDASDDPIWLEAEAGMRVEIYTLREAKIYKLIL